MDSSSGLTEEQANKLGFYFIPLYLQIDGVEYRDGIDINSKSIFEKYTLESEVKTSSFSPATAIELFDLLTNKFDRIFVFPISYALSGAYQNFVNIAKDYKNITVIESKTITVLSIVEAIWLKHQLEKDFDKWPEYVNIIENNKLNFAASLVPKHNKYLVKGGRLTKGAAIVARMLKIVPIINLENGALVKGDLGRIYSKTVLKLVNSMVENVKKQKINPLWFMLEANNDKAEKEATLSELKKHSNDVILANIPSVMSIHTGQDATVIAWFELEEDIKQEVIKVFEEIINK